MSLKISQMTPLAAKLTASELIELSRTDNGGSTYQTYSTSLKDVLDAGGAAHNVQHYGAVGDGKIAFTAQITASTNTLTLTNTAGVPQDLFSADDVGKRIVVAWAGPGQANLWTTIESYVSPTEVTLTAFANFSTPGNSMAAWYPVGRNDTPGIQAAIDATSEGSSEVFMPAGVYVYKGATAGTGAINNTNAPFLTAVRGAGSQRTWLICDSDTDWANVMRFNDPNVGFNLKGFSVFGPGMNGSAGGDIQFRLVNQGVCQQIDVSNVNVFHSCGYGFWASVPILFSFRNCLACWTLNDGFYVHDGTSVHFDSCYSLSSAEAGFRCDVQSYSTFTSCAVEGAGIGYYMVSSNTIVFNGTGGEVLSNRPSMGALYNGSMFVFSGGSGGITLNGCYGRELAVAGSRYVKTVNNASHVTVTGFRVNNTQFTPDYDFEISAGSENCSFKNCNSAYARLLDNGTNTEYSLGSLSFGPAWTTPTLLNSWVNYAGGFATAAYRREGNRVYLRGLIANGTITAGTVLFTLPAGLRPPANQIFAQHHVNGHCRVDVHSNGNVLIYEVTGGAFLSLDGIDFAVDL